METELDRYLNSSAKINVDDLDWAEAKRVGLTADERFVLTYFADIEGQTIFYLRDLLHTKAAAEPDVIGFTTMWNYEEYFHSRVLIKLLNECGCSLEDERIAKVRTTSLFSEKIEAFASVMISKTFRNSFPALYMTWGATQEITTLRGYEQVIRTTKNPVLREICERIAKQERRHFAWYFNSARQRLEKSKTARWLTRTLMDLTWSPVGAGVKTDEEVSRMMCLLFPGNEGDEISVGIDAKIATLPGMDGVNLMARYQKKAREIYQRWKQKRGVSSLAQPENAA